MKSVIFALLFVFCVQVAKADEYYDLGCYVGNMTREQFYAQKNTVWQSNPVVQVKKELPPCRVKFGDKIRNSGNYAWFLGDGDLMTVEKITALDDEYAIVCKIDKNGMFHQTYSSRLKFPTVQPKEEFKNPPLTASQRERYWIWMAKNHPEKEHLEAPLVWEPYYSVWSAKFRPDLEK